MPGTRIDSRACPQSRCTCSRFPCFALAFLSRRPALGAEVARDRARSLADGRRNCGFACAAVQPLPRAGDTNAADDRAVASEDRRRDADLAQHCLLTLDGIAAFAHALELV